MRRLAWIRRLALLAVFCFAGLTSYVLDKLVDLQDELGEDVGENVVWAMSQALYQSGLTVQAAQRAEQDPSQRQRLTIQHQVLKGRLNILTESSLRAFMPRAGVWEDIERAQRIIEEPAPDYLAIQALMRDVGNRVMLTEREDAGTRRDKHSELMWQLMFSVIGVLASGAVLCWQLLHSLRRAELANAEVVRQHAQARRLLDALELERSARQRYRDFVSLMSHQLRTPLAVIDSSAQRLVRQGEGQGQSIEDRSRRIRQSVHQLNQLIARVLEGLRVEDPNNSGNVTIEPVPCEWRDILREVLDKLDETLDERQVVMSWPQGERLELVCDPMWCGEILGNLLSNAHKYSSQGLPVEIDSHVEDGWLRCSVRDHGDGIAGQDMARVFERFYRGPWVSRAPGVGLGLSIARTLAEWHGGRLEASNAEGGGAVFLLSLPLAGPLPADATSAAAG